MKMLIDNPLFEIIPQIGLQFGDASGEAGREFSEDGVATNQDRRWLELGADHRK